MSSHVVSFSNEPDFLGVQACGYSGRRLPDPSSYSAPCLVQQQIRFTRQRFLYAVFVFPSLGALFQQRNFLSLLDFSRHSGNLQVTDLFAWHGYRHRLVNCSPVEGYF